MPGPKPTVLQGVIAKSKSEIWTLLQDFGNKLTSLGLVAVDEDRCLSKDIIAAICAFFPHLTILRGSFNSVEEVAAVLDCCQRLEQLEEFFGSYESWDRDMFYHLCSRRVLLCIVPALEIFRDADLRQLAANCP
jgi:hypothetical protein